MARYPFLKKVLGATWQPNYSPSFEKDEEYEFGPDDMVLEFSFESTINMRKSLKEPAKIGDETPDTLDDLQTEIDNHVEGLEAKAKAQIEADVKKSIKGASGIDVEISSSSHYVHEDNATREQMLQQLEDIEVTATVKVWLPVPLKEMAEAVKKAVETTEL